MCPAAATHFVVVDDYRCGVLTGGEFTPAETGTNVCVAHHNRVRSAPGFGWSRPLGEEGA